MTRARHTTSAIYCGPDALGIGKLIREATRYCVVAPPREGAEPVVIHRATTLRLARKWAAALRERTWCKPDDVRIESADRLERIE